LAGEDLHINDNAFDPRRTDQGSITNIAGLFAEDRAEQLFFRGKLSFALGCDLSDQHIARLDVGTDPDDSGFVKILQEGLTDVWNVPRDFLRSELGVSRFDFKFLDMNRGVVIVLDQ